MTRQLRALSRRLRPVFAAALAFFHVYPGMLVVAPFALVCLYAAVFNDSGATCP